MYYFHIFPLVGPIFPLVLHNVLGIVEVAVGLILEADLLFLGHVLLGQGHLSLCSELKMVLLSFSLCFVGFRDCALEIGTDNFHHTNDATWCNIFVLYLFFLSQYYRCR